MRGTCAERAKRVVMDSSWVEIGVERAKSAGVAKLQTRNPLMIYGQWERKSEKESRKEILLTRNFRAASTGLVEIRCLRNAGAHQAPPWSGSCCGTKGPKRSDDFPKGRRC